MSGAKKKFIADVRAQLVARGFNWNERDIRLCFEAIEAVRGNINVKPKPIAFTIIEGGVWIMWGGKVTPAIMHAIEFKDGSIFDAINGWRET